MTNSNANHSDRLQKLLPSGLKIVGNELHGSREHSGVYFVEDCRADVERPVRRVVRFLEVKGVAATWQKPVLDRAHRLLEQQLPFVLPIREIGKSDDVVYLVHDAQDHVIAIPLGKGFSPATAQAIGEQLLTGLAALHQAGIAHGDVRPVNVFVSQVLSADKRFTGILWLADAEIGGLVQWSAGRYPANGAKDYFPPEWKNGPKEPTFQSDLYMLGKLLWVLWQGKSGDGDSEESRPPQPIPWSWRWVPDPRPEGRLRYLLALLLAEQEQRPPDAAAVREAVRGRQVVMARVGIAVSLLVFCILSGGWFTNNANLKRLIETRILVAEANKENKKLKAEVIKLTADVDWLNGLTGRDPSEKSKKSWSSVTLDTSSREDAIKKIKEKIKSLNDGSDRVIFDTWLKQCEKKRSANDDLWQKADSELGKRFSTATKAPWEKANWDAVEDRLLCLTDAAVLWQTWARDPSIEFKDLDTKIAPHKESVRSILNSWLKDLDQHGTWTLQLKKGTAPKDYGTERYARIYVERWIDTKVHDWSDEKEHDYSNDLEHRRINFEWTKGAPIIVALCSPNRVRYWPYRIYDDRFNGPLAIWLLHFEGKSAQDGFELDYEVDNCPGPPPEVFF